MKMLDLFSGIGGFHLGFKQAGFNFDYVGFSEIDKYASAVYKYNFPLSKELGDVRAIRYKDLPKIDLITFGSPCQDFSIAGKRYGMQGDRSSLITEAIRLINECRPRFFVWENVKGTFSSNDGADFWAIIQAFTNIGGYRLEWQLLNTRWFPKTPQNRERIYLVGYFGDRGRRSIFPIGEDDRIYNNKQTGAKPRAEYYSSITTKEGTRKENNFIITEPQVKQIGKVNNGDSGKVFDPNGLACTLKSLGGGWGAKTGLYRVSAVRSAGNKDGSRYYYEDDVTQTIASNPTSDNLPMVNQTSIRRLTPVETMRLQGFPDNFNEFGLLDGKKVVISDTQRYRQAGNAVTVDVVEAVARKIKKLL
jgi:DNA (cytosine-5)-methyltransferase 1